MMEGISKHIVHKNEHMQKGENERKRLVSRLTLGIRILPMRVDNHGIFRRRVCCLFGIP